MQLGILLALVATLLYNVGFVLQKSALGKVSSLARAGLVEFVRVLFTSPLWVAGFVSVLAGLSCQILVLAILPLTVVQPIGVCGIVLLLLLSQVFLAERLTGPQWRVVGLISVSFLLIVFSLSPGGEAAGTGSHLRELCAVSIPTAVLALVVFTSAERGALRRHRRAAGGVAHGLAAGLFYGIAGLDAKGVAGLIDPSDLRSAVLSAITSPFPYLLVSAAGAGFALFQTALQRHQASVVVPVSNVVSNIHVVATGTVIFGEHFPANPVRLLLRLAGFAGAVLALVLLSRASAAPAGPAAPAAPAGRHRTEQKGTTRA